jgi:class 3 adenylate cyclase
MFRTKMLLAMMLVVAGVSAATLFVTQHRVQQNYERMFRTQFQRQVSYFTSLQEARLGAVKEQCLKLAQSVRFVSAMNEPEIDSTNLYRIGVGELRSVLNEFGDEPRPPRARGAGKLESSFFRFVDSQGKPIVQPENPGGGRFGPGLRRSIEKRFGYARDALNAPEVQQVAYLPMVAQTNQFEAARGMQARGKSLPKSGETGPLALTEIIITKVIDPTDNRTLGALVLGFPLPALIPQPKRAAATKVPATNQTDIIQTGILIEEQLFADPAAIPDSIGAALAQEISKRLREHHETESDFGCEIEGMSYRVFFELMNEGSAFPAAYQVCLYSMAEARREQADLRWRIIGLGAAALAVALISSLIISHGLSAPIRQLVSGTNEIQKGNFRVRVPVRSRDEIGQLAASFNEMAEGLAQKERYRTVLNMVADEKIAQRLLAGEVTLGGELREITVLFCDIRGFTTLTQNMPPGEVIEMLNEHMTALTRIVKQHHGVLDKFVGDLLMAIFGAPLTHGDDTGNATRCALDLLRVREELNRTSRHRIQIGIGLATGTAVAGCMGSVDRLNYTVLGERVNLASRLCGKARANEILIDENTREKLGNAATAEPIADMELKGFASLVTAYRLVDLNSPGQNS